LEASASGSWNRHSFFFCLLLGYLKFSEDFLETLNDLLVIADVKSFLEFFKRRPSSFLMRLPVAMLHPYHDHLYMAWSITKFFTNRLHLLENRPSFAVTYVEPYTSQNDLYCLVLRDITRFLSLNMKTLPSISLMIRYQRPFIMRLDWTS
jgi:hypothetical protein